MIFCTGVPMVIDMGENMSIMFGVTTIRPPFIQWKQYLLNNARTNFCLNIECIDLTNGVDPTVEIFTDPFKQG